MKKSEKQREKSVKREKAYTIEELLELGRKNNSISIAKPLFEGKKEKK